MNETERNERAKEGSCPGIKNGCCVGRMSIAEEWGGANEEHTAQTIERVGTSDEKEAKTVTARLARATSRRAETMSGGWPLKKKCLTYLGFQGAGVATGEDWASVCSKTSMHATMSTKRSEAKWAGAQWASVHALAGKGSEKKYYPKRSEVWRFFISCLLYPCGYVFANKTSDWRTPYYLLDCNRKCQAAYLREADRWLGQDWFSFSKFYNICLVYCLLPLDILLFFYLKWFYQLNAV